MSHPAFEQLRSERIESLNLTVEEYRHTGTGARHYHLAADDDNNAFLVAFLTVPQDSTGVAHILEHTSLCGSERFPVRDPFFMMMRRSLSTFMNAFTSSDWTAYPFASRNRKDFDNLLQVYLDAVFFPRLDALDFAQEGHRVEFSDPDDPASDLVFKGVVYNEMKGAMSSPVSRLWQLLHGHLFPTITYHYNSGGEPEDIPNLTHAQLKAFHARHYHPSNAVFLTYGDQPAVEHQRRLVDYALARFQRQDMHLAVPDERRYDAPLTREERYPLDGEEDTADKSHVVMGWLLGHSADLAENLHAHLLSGVLLDNSASPLRRALETTDLGNAPSDLCGLDDSPREMAFFCGLEGTESDRSQAIEDLVLGVIRDVAENGVPQEVVESVLHQLELSQREISGGHFPYGLRLMVNALTPALHGGDPVAFLNLDPVLDELREAVRDPGFVPALARRLLLDNPHRVRVAMAPDTELSQAQMRKEMERLASRKAAMDEAEKAAVVAQAQVLKERQMQQDDPGVLPKVGLEDVPPDLHAPEGEAGQVAHTPATWYAAGTNGLVYTKLITDFPILESADLDLLPLYCAVVSELGCGERDYLQAQAWQAAVTGGVSAGYSMRGEIDNTRQARAYFTLSGKALARNHAAMGEVLREVFHKPRFDEAARLRELIAQMRAQREMSVTDHGHVLAMSAACAGMGPVAALSHRWGGLLGVRRLKALDEALNDGAGMADFAAGLERIRARLLAAPRQFLLVGEAAQREPLEQALERLWQEVPRPAADGGAVPQQDTGQVREGWAVNTQVNFCAQAYATVPIEHPDAAALMVLGRFLTNGFLHRTIREQGGAYGAGASYDSDSGAFRFYSYRDPRIEGTLEDFGRSLDWLAEQHSQRELEEAILSVIGAIDRPESPAGEASRTFFGILHGRTPEQRRQFRQRVLAVHLDDLNRVGQAWLQPEWANTAVVSDARTLKEKADALGLEVRTL